MKPFQERKSLSEVSTFGIGGVARFFTEVSTIEELQEVLAHCHERHLPFHVVGKGSNCLFPDSGYDGLALLNKISFCHFEGGVVSVGGGYSFSLLGAKTAKRGLSGLEFASGIPATVGGAIFMNAGANGSETADTLKEVTFVDERGKLRTIAREELSFSYRMSSFHAMKGVIAAAKFELQPFKEAREKQLAIIDYRTKTQPYGEKSCGCVFQNPEGFFAGALIEQCGLMGKRIGGAEVSSVHANFIINRGGATSEDVLALVSHIKECVKRKTGVDLKTELKIISHDGISS